MNRRVLNLMIDTVAAALLTTLVGSGYILWVVLPPGTNRTHILWGLLRHQWGTVHTWISVILLTVLAVHVALHWRWLITGLSRRFGVAAWAARSPRLMGLMVLAAAALPLTTLAIAAHVSVQPIDPPLHPLADEPREAATPVAPGGTAPAGRVSGASAPVTSPGPGVSAPDEVIARAATVLVQRCATCHGDHEPAAGIRADTPGALREEQNGVRWITPGRPDESRLFEVVGLRFVTGRMAAQHGLSQSEVDALSAWIASLND